MHPCRTFVVLAGVPVSSAEEVAAKIAAAKNAQPSWALVPLLQRIKLLKAVCKSLAPRAEELAALVTAEMGKVLAEAAEEISGVVDKDDMLDQVAAANAPERIDNGLIVREPLGVVAVCSPWNFPADEALLLALPALAAGNTVVIKPSEVVPLIGAEIASALINGLPMGVVQLVQGDGEVGAALVGGDVQMVGMTGSSATGKKIMETCSKDLKRLVLELGGKDPMVVFADADLEQAAVDAVTNSLYNCGQVCCSVERIYVEESVLPEFEARCAKLGSQWAAGDGMTSGSKIGPMVSAMQRDAVAAQVNAAVASGARIVAQAPIPDAPGGNYYPATVLSGITQDMAIQHSELFGPVVALASFGGTEAQAVELSNDTEYGLAAYIYSKDLEKASRVAMGVKAGQIGINNWSMLNAPGGAPWVGHKASGFGYHSGADGWRQFSVPKTLVFESIEDLHEAQSVTVGAAAAL
eukprot:COSAG02_NODE_3162_length_7248_cov_147.217793_6_plen_467_part_00